MQEKHKEAVEQWEEKCRGLRAEGVLIRNLPKRPARPLKPKKQVCSVESPKEVEGGQVEDEQGPSSEESTDGEENDD